jgi:HlyD family secretion protein
VLKNAERNTARQQELATKGFAAQAALDNAIRDGEVAHADIAVAKAQIASAEATIKQRKAALDQATIDLDRTDIRSPIEGTVISRTIDPGQTVAASLQAPELFKIAQDLSRVRIEAQVNEADVGAVAEGNAATFTVDAYPDRQFEGKVTQVRLASTELNGVVTYTVIIEAANAERKLFPGMTANVAIESARREDALRVVNDALRYKPRNAAASASGRERGQGGGADRSGRMLASLKTELGLTGEQEQAVKEALDKLGQERRESTQGTLAGPPLDQSAARQRMTARIEQALSPLLTEAQRPAYEKWKQGRETTRLVALWVLGADGEPERRMVRTGLSDDRFTEVLSGIEEGDKVVVRAREAKS